MYRGMGSSVGPKPAACSKCRNPSFPNPPLSPGPSPPPGRASAPAAAGGPPLQHLGDAEVADEDAPPASGRPPRAPARRRLFSEGAPADAAEAPRGRRGPLGGQRDGGGLRTLKYYQPRKP